MSVLVTGAAGFVGSHLVDALVSAGEEVVAIDDLSSGRLANLSHARAAAGGRLSFHRTDITSSVAAGVVAKHRPDVMFHLAAQVDVRASVADPVRDATVNLIGTINLLQACAQAGVRKVVFTSSGGAIYGEPRPSALPVSEKALFGVRARPTSPYGVGKKVALDYLRYFREERGLDFTALALANVYGPRQEPAAEVGLEGAVVAIFCRRMLARRPCTIYGDGTQTRDFVHVVDVVAALTAAFDRGGGELINIGTGKEVSVAELHDALASIVGTAVEPQREPARAGDLLRSSVDPSKAAAVLGWRPRVDLVPGLEDTVAWFRANPA